MVAASIEALYESTTLPSESKVSTRAHFEPVASLTVADASTKLWLSNLLDILEDVAKEKYPASKKPEFSFEMSRQAAL